MFCFIRVFGVIPCTVLSEMVELLLFSGLIQKRVLYLTSFTVLLWPEILPPAYVSGARISFYSISFPFSYCIFRSHGEGECNRPAFLLALCYVQCFESPWPPQVYSFLRLGPNGTSCVDWSPSTLRLFRRTVGRIVPVLGESSIPFRESFQSFPPYGRRDSKRPLSSSLLL